MEDMEWAEHETCFILKVEALQLSSHISNSTKNCSTNYERVLTVVLLLQLQQRRLQSSKLHYHWCGKKAKHLAHYIKNTKIQKPKIQFHFQSISPSLLSFVIFIYSGNCFSLHTVLPLILTYSLTLPTFSVSERWCSSWVSFLQIIWQSCHVSSEINWSFVTVIWCLLSRYCVSAHVTPLTRTQWRSLMVSRWTAHRCTMLALAR